MKKFALFLIVAALITLGNAPMGKPAAEVVLNASQVTSAVDIEMAIAAATANGTRPGIVTLDGSQGKFIYTADDRSINILYSNFTLRSFNWATIGNCADGVFFDDVPVSNVVITGIELVCLDGHSVSASYPSAHKNIVLRNNWLESGSHPTLNLYRSEGWTITDNWILSLGTAIFLNESKGVTIRNNVIRANVGADLLNAGPDNALINNRFSAYQRGVVLSGESMRNQITGNHFDRVQEMGVFLPDPVSGNKIIGNKVACWPEVGCTAVVASDTNYEHNKIVGNKLVKKLK